MIGYRNSLVVAAVFPFFLSTLDAATASEKEPDLTEILNCAISKPKPEYPHDAKLHWIEGRGWYAVRVQISTGRVKQVKIMTSAGDRTLDQAAIACLTSWRFKPGALPSIRHFSPQSKDPLADEDSYFKMPVTFALNRPKYRYLSGNHRVHSGP